MLNRLRCMSKLNCQVQICLDSAESPAIVQQVRWRKRRWAPVIMEKKLNPVDKVRLPEDQWLFLRDHYTKYNSKIRSIKLMWSEEYKGQKLEEEKQSKTDDIAHLQRQDYILALNNKWNEETAKIRNTRLQRESEMAEEERLQNEIEMEEAERTIEEEARKAVLEQKEAAEKFIDINNLEEEIERALNTRVNYNFAIDTSGTKYIELEDGSVIVEGDEPLDSKDIREAVKS